jgi:hypothetical protein
MFVKEHSHSVDGGHGGVAGDVPLNKLLEELGVPGQVDVSNCAPPSGDDATGGEAIQRAEAVLEEIISSVSPTTAFRFDEEIVKRNLDELLVLLVAMRETETHGKALMDDLWRLFDSRLSPGTVYPSLHELEEGDVLEMFELVRTKEYRIDDQQEAQSMVLEAGWQHLVLGLMFISAGGSEF